MNRWLIIALGIFAAAVAIAIAAASSFLESDVSVLLVTACSLIAITALLRFVSTFDDRSRASLRLDWFLPQLRRHRAGERTNSRWTGRWLRQLVPKRWISDHRTKQRGSIRKTLRRLGISWLASPVRRIVQSICLLVFLVLFFYTCWPYTARPDPPGQVSSGWQLVATDQIKGEFQLAKPDAESWAGEAEIVFIEPAESGAGKVSVVAVTNDGGIIVAPLDGTPDYILDALLIGESQWTIHQRDPDAWPSHYSDDLAAKEFVPAELFLTIDPLVSLSTAIASRSWVWSLVSAAVILLVCVLVPRGFCGYVCPLGTTIDLFDWAFASRTRRFRVPEDGWWVHIKYYLLGGTLIAAACGILVSGFVAAIPVITRGLLFIGEPLQSGTLRGWHLVPEPNWGHALSLAMFLGVLALGFLRPRFWCKYVCPSGAVFSLGNLLRVTERKVESSCIHCNKCVEICPLRCDQTGLHHARD